MAVVRSDAFRDVDRLFQQLWDLPQPWGTGGRQDGTPTRPLAMPMDAYRKDGSVLMTLDLPGIDAGSIELTVEGNALRITADRAVPPTSEDVETVIAERPYGRFSRQVLLGEHLDREHIAAAYDAGVLTVSIPVAQHAKPRRIEVTAGAGTQQLSA